MNRSELKKLKPGDTVYSKKDGRAYEYVRTSIYDGRIYDLLLKPLDGGEMVYINSKRLKIK